MNHHIGKKGICIVKVRSVKLGKYRMNYNASLRIGLTDKGREACLEFRAGAWCGVEAIYT